MQEFKQLTDLVNWLTTNDVALAFWGTENSKTVENLWDEYVGGEVSFQDDPPLRIVEVVQLIIGRDDKILVEEEQEFSNGQRRFRNRPPSEKIKHGETIEAAALRCLQEELGLTSAQIDFDNAEPRKTEKILESPSYPGLMTRYTLHTFEIQAASLPNQAFWRQNSAAGPGDPVKRHLWDWEKRK